jgi:hypothetical protein
MLGKVLPHECAELAVVIDNQDVTGGACAQEIRSGPNKFRPQLIDAQERGQKEFVTEHFSCSREPMFCHRLQQSGYLPETSRG